MTDERVLIFDSKSTPLEGHVLEFPDYGYWMVLRLEADPDAVWRVRDYEFAEAVPKTIRAVLRPATQREVDEDQAWRNEPDERPARKTWWQRVFAAGRA